MLAVKSCKVSISSIERIISLESNTVLYIWKRIQVHSEDVVSTYTWKRMHAFGGIQALCSVAKGS